MPGGNRTCPLAEEHATWQNDPTGHHHLRCQMALPHRLTSPYGATWQALDAPPLRGGLCRNWDLFFLPRTGGGWL